MDKYRSSHQHCTEGVVVLLHGLGRSRYHMQRLEKELSKAAYCVINIDYPSQRHGMDALSDYVYSALQAEKVVDSDLDIVGYSLGAVLIRALLKRHPELKVRRIVMLAPPNQGSEIADFYADLPIFNWFFGPALLELTTDAIKDNASLKLNLCHYEVGVIAGYQTLDPIHSQLLPGENDGKVSVQSTVIEGMTDHITLPMNHTFFPQSSQVIKQTRHFLKFGQFQH